MTSTTHLPPLEQSIYSDIAAIKALDSLEQRHQSEVLDWIASGAPLFRIKKPDTPPKHLVSYFVLVDPRRKSILLADHIKAQLWLPPGGHVEAGEHPATTVRRESQEELQKEAVFLHNNPKPLFVTSTVTVGLTAGHTDVSLWYVITGSEHEYIHFDRGEFNEVAWFTFDEILESSSVIFDPHMQRFTRKLIEVLS